MSPRQSARTWCVEAPQLSAAMLQQQTAVALMQNDVPGGEGKIVRHPCSAIWRRARLRLRRRSGQRRKEVMLSDLSVSARHQRRRGAKLQVCSRRCVRRVLGPHHSGEIRRRPRPKSKAAGAPRGDSPMIYSHQNGF